MKGRGTLPVTRRAENATKSVAGCIFEKKGGDMW